MIRNYIQEAALGILIIQAIIMIAASILRPAIRAPSVLIGVLIAAVASIGIIADLEVRGFRPHLLSLVHGLALLGIPTVYFYIRSLTLPQVRFSALDLIQFLPGLVVFFVLGARYALNDEVLPISIRSRFQEFNSVVLAIYLFLAYRRIRIHSKLTAESYSDAATVELNWLKLVLGLFVGILCWSIFEQVFDPERQLLGVWPVVMAFSLVILNQQSTRWSYLLGANEILSWVVDQKRLSAISEVDASEKLRYAGSKKSDSEILACLQKVNDAMRSAKIYLDPNLKLSQLAKAVRLSGHELSEVINRGAKMTFYDYVNSFRIEEAKSQLVDANKNDNTILDIAISAGFNSKSVFNSAFKKATKLTPSEFRASFSNANRGEKNSRAV